MKKIKNRQFKRKTIFLVFILLITAVFLVPRPALAGVDVWGAVASVLGAILIPIVSLIGRLITVMIRLLVTVAQYNDFINSAAVTKGWIIIRDIFNMFFIFILLLIAFGTVLKIEKYSYKRLLGAFLLAAILINFSKLICGVFIDIAQVIMLTFVNAFKTVGEGNMAKLLGLERLMALRADTGTTDLTKELVGAILLAFIMTTIALVVVTIITLIFVFRIVILWFLVLLSPVAFMGSVLPSFQRYANQWWEKFTSQVIIGPVLAFFLWLSFAMVQGSGNVYQNVVIPGSVTAEYLAGDVSASTSSTGSILAAAVSEAGKPECLLNFVIGIAMLLGSLMVAQQMGVAGGKMAGQALNKIQAIGSGIAKAPFKGLGKTTKFIASEGIREMEASTGIPLTKTRWKGILEERKELSVKKRNAKFATRPEKGFLSYLPKGQQGWAHVLSLKEGPKAFGRFFQGITGKANRLRNEESNLVGEDEKVDAEMKSKISKTEIMEENKKQSKNLQVKESKQNQLETDFSNFATTGGRIMRLNNVDGYLENLEKQIEKWRAKNENDPKIAQAEDFAEDLRELANQAKKDGKGAINLNRLPPGVNKSSHQQDISEWFKKRIKTGKKEVKQAQETYTQWEQRRANYDFTQKDHQKVKDNLQDLTAKIGKLDIDNEAKKDLMDKISGLTKDLDVPFSQLTPEKRNEIADQVWNIQRGLSKEVNNLEENGKINSQEADEIIKPGEEVHSLLSKEIIEDEEIKEISKEREKRKQKIKDLHIRAEVIQPRTMSPDQKKAIHALVMDEYEKVKDIDDADELSTIYLRAEKEKNTALARAVLMKLNGQGDLNEFLEKIDLEQSFKGMADLAKRMHKNLEMNQQEAYMFINDLAYKNKAAGHFMFMSPVVRDRETGLYRATKREEHEKIVMIESGKKDPEKFYRDGSWMGMFAKTKNPKTGIREPVPYNVTINMGLRDIDMIHRELRRNFRLQKEIERNMSHQDIIAGLEEGLFGLPREQREKMEEVLSYLKSKQSTHWPKK